MSKCILDTLQISFQTNPKFSKLSNQQIPLLAMAQAVRMTLPMQRQNPFFSPPAISASDIWAGAAWGDPALPSYAPGGWGAGPAPTASMNLLNSFSSSCILAPNKDATLPIAPYKQQSPFAGIFLKIGIFLLADLEQIFLVNHLWKHTNDYQSQHWQETRKQWIQLVGQVMIRI